MTDLFASLRPDKEIIRDGVVLLPAFVDTTTLLPHIQAITADAPFRHMMTPGGRRMNVAMSNCGPLGWVSEPTGYRYADRDPLSGQPWPQMPALFRDLAGRAAAKAGFEGFEPDACLVNRYEAGTVLTPHQDMDEADKSWPIVSVSIGLSATFQLYGLTRGGTPDNIRLHDGDVIVFGGVSRLVYHGVKKLEAGQHALTGPYRYNLTFRRAR